MKLNFFRNLKNKLKKKEAVICIIGLGYVGLELFKSFQKKNFSLIGVDLDNKKVEKIKKFLKTKKTLVTSKFEYIKKADIIIIALPTPLTKSLKPNLSYIKSCLRSIKPYLKKGQLISLESTTYPGTTQKIIGEFIKRKNFNLSEDFFLVYSPERISPELKVKYKKIKYNFKNTPKVCSGYSKKCQELGKLLYKNVVNKVVLASSLKIAETTKMVENIFRSVNIALVNELKMFLNKVDIDINETLDLANTKPFGFTKFNPGPGYGGHCIPIDPFYLYWLAKKNNFDLKFIKTSGLVNNRVSTWITKKIIDFIKKNKIKLYQKKILILGVAYKKNIDDTRESPAFEIIKKLRKKNIDFEFSDPYVDSIRINGEVKKSKNITKSLLRKYKLVLIVTDHTKFNYKLISKETEFIFDSRNAIKNRKKGYFKI
jgi:UDP-N-acetyl-D-glucosamine dehydrogenase